MTIKASSQITISKVIDIYACYRYYKLQGSTLAKPTKPTKNPPDGWSDTEPAYISGSTNTLYFVDCNVYSDKTFSFSEVSKSSSYEAAKDAWNKANKAQDTATNAQNKVDNLQIGGRNLKLNGDFKKGLTAYGTEGDVNVSIENDVTYTKCAKVVFSTAYASERLYTTDYNNRYNLLNTVYTLSFVAKASSNLKLNVYRAGTAQGIGETNLSTEWKKFEMTYTATGTGSVTFKLNSAGTLYLANIKLELGNKATDWTPAPEDGIAKVDVEYYLSTSSTSLAGGSWTTIAPAWVNGKYMWSRTVTIDGAGNKTYSPNQNGVCIAGAKGATGAQGPKGDTGAQGPKGDKGTTGATGKGVKSTAITYQASTSGVVTPTGTWSTTIPAVSAGSYLWTRTIITYTDNNTSTSYSVGKMGNTGAQGPKGDTGAQGPKGDKGNTGATGAAGKGIKSTSVTYQAGTTGVAVPTGTWSTTIPSTSASKPFLWSRTIITYTDNTTSTTYSVGSTADSVQVGGRNLIIDSDKLSKWIYTGINGYDAEVKEYNTTKYPSGKYTECKCTKAGTGLYISAGCYNNTNKIMKGDTVTLSGWVYCSVDKGLLSPTIEFASNITWKVRPKLCTTWSYFECTIVSRTDIPTATGGVAICFYNTFAVNEVIAFSSFKLEKGNKATDWTPAPEDLIKSITEANTAIEKTDEKISMKASVDSVTEISNRANEIEGMLSEAKTTIARHEESIQLLTSDEFTVKFTNVVQQITSVDGKFEQYKEKMDNWLRFDKNGNLIIGSTRVPGQPAYEIMIGKNRISFLLNDIEVAYISDDEMHINKSTVMESITIGRENQKFIWEMRGNGNLGLVWR